VATAAGALLKLVEMQKGGHPVDLASLAQAFIEMNTALEAAMVVASRPAPLDDQQEGAAS
jgi:hypothetical protein